MIRAEGNVSMAVEANAAKVETVRATCPTLRHFIVLGSTRPGWVAYDAAMATASETFTPALTRSAAPAIIYFTSGTTGGPKMVLHTHASDPLAHLVTGKYWLHLQPRGLHLELSRTRWAKAA